MPRGGMRFLFADYTLKPRELRRGSEPIEAEPLLRLVQQLGEPNASLGISNLSEVLSFRPPWTISPSAQKTSENLGFLTPALAEICYVTWGTISNGLFLY